MWLRWRTHTNSKYCDITMQEERGQKANLFPHWYPAITFRDADIEVPWLLNQFLLVNPPRQDQKPHSWWGRGGWAGLGASLEVPSRQFSRRSSCLGSSSISLSGPMLWFECGFLKEKIPYFTVTPIWLAVIREKVISKRSSSIQKGTGLTEMQL